MSTKFLLKMGALAAGSLLMASCSQTNDMFDRAGLSANGLGKLTHFAGQEAGEMFTTQAPHNQIYLFAYDNSGVASKYVASIHAQANYLKSHKNARVLLAGHTDERGSREYNVALGERRAKSVAQMLRLAGVDKRQMRVISYGKERPINLGHDAESRAQNRRVELTYEAK